MKKITSLKWKIGKYLLIFGAFLIGVIFLFQIILLKPMYESYKINSIRRISDNVIKVLEDADDEDDLEELIYNTQNESGTCVRVWQSTTGGPSAAMMSGNGCFLYRMKPEEADQLILNAMNSEDGTYLQTKSSFSFMDENDTRRELILTRIVGDEDSKSVIMVYSGITPVDSTISTLRAQLWIISGFIALAVILLTLALNYQIARPLSIIAENAKSLPEGKYTADEKTNRYSEAMQLNETLSEAARDISKADQAKRDLIANVSHDLRTPLTMISGYGEMMIDLPEEKTDENIRVIIDESKRLTTLVNDLLDLSKMQESRITLNPEIFDLSLLVEEQLKKYDVYTMKEGYQIESSLEKNAFIKADYSRIAQVFNNFMTNAINYCGSDRRIIVKEYIKDGVVRCEVRDFGEGIDEKNLPQIWDRYYKLDKTHVRSTSGSGIGLSIVKEILELHQAKYGAISKKGEGSTFWFEFRLEEGA
ncbi:MAG: HAMP domain-containing sensor histidine kinase [Erysipelotrichaceae bacterium]|nr:HAMP domain-containing sensor histidine kinase [Erysipelotrichaceae bacterium]